MICTFPQQSNYKINNSSSINYNPVYRETVRQPIKVAEYYKNKPEDLEKYRQTWTKKEALFETTYTAETDKIAKTIINKNNN